MAFSSFYIILYRVFRWKNPVIEMMEMADGCHKGTPFVRETPPTIFKIGSILFYRSIVYILEMCMLLGFLFFIINAKSTNC